MARYLVNQFSSNPYHITGRISNREVFRLPLEQIWLLMSEHLWLAHHVDGLRIHAFVLMPNHFHLIVSIESGPISVPLTRLMRESSRSFNYYAGRVDQNWGTRHYKCEIKGYTNFVNVYKYVYQNPVRARLTKTADEWTYSTLYGLLGRSRLSIPVLEDTLLFNGNSLDWRTLDWLNRDVSPDNLQSIRKGLTRKIYTLPATKSRRAHPLYNALI